MSGPTSGHAARYSEQVEREFTFAGAAGRKISLMAGGSGGTVELAVMTGGKPDTLFLKADSSGAVSVRGSWSDAETGSAPKVPQFFTTSPPLDRTQLREKGWAGIYAALPLPEGGVCRAPDKRVMMEIQDDAQRLFSVRAFCGARDDIVFLSIGIDERPPEVRAERMESYRRCMIEVERKGLDSGC